MLTEATTATDVLIVGGGIGGLATALALSRSGLTVRVLERAPEFSEVGAGIQLAPNATRLLRSWGLLDQILAVGIRPKRLVLSDAFTGAELTALDLGEAFEQRYGAPYVVLHRTDLLDVLLAACRVAGVILENDKSVTDVSSEPDMAEVTVADGTSYSASLVVAADGLHSTLRRYLSEDEPIVAGFVAFRGAVPLTEVKRHASLDEVQLYVGPGIHLVQYPVRSGNMYNQVAVFRSQRFLDGEPDWGTPAELYGTFAETCTAVRDSVDSLWSDQRWLMYDREPLDTWVSGRLVLLGDAAHPMLQYLAQGACQSFEDAAMLTESLRRLAPAGPADGDQLAAALADYVAHRQPRTARAQRNARHWGDIWHSDGIAVLLRNEIFARREATDFNYTDWLFEHAPGLGRVAADTQEADPAAPAEQVR
ncbi:MAG: 3-hydroxybenzoate 6-monooxygenase [Pseudonocardiales bacterium]|nr:3-hydroxybenzoate 6-monooxygenase [Pseudonocardiales bacterium]